MKIPLLRGALLGASALGLLSPSLLTAQVIPLNGQLTGYTLPGANHSMIATWGGQGTLSSGSDFWSTWPFSGGVPLFAYCPCLWRKNGKEEARIG